MNLTPLRTDRIRRSYGTCRGKIQAFSINYWRSTGETTARFGRLGKDVRTDDNGNDGAKFACTEAVLTWVA